MRSLICVLVLGVFIFSSGVVYCGTDDPDDSEGSPGGNEALTGALLGGLLGAGLGTAIGSASGNAGKGALIGGGIGAVGGTLLGANQAAAKRAKERTYIEPAPVQDSQNVSYPEPEVPSNVKIKKRIIRKYDEDGNVISEKEVKQ